MCEAVDTEPHELTEFDREVDALRQILGLKRVMSVDELRRGIEAIPEAEYHARSYSSAGSARSPIICSARA